MFTTIKNCGGCQAAAEERVNSLRHTLEEAQQSTRRLEGQVADRLSAQEAADAGLKAQEKEIKELHLRNSHMHQAVESAEGKIAELQVVYSCPISSACL